MAGDLSCREEQSSMRASAASNAVVAAFVDDVSEGSPLSRFDPAAILCMIDVVVCHFQALFLTSLYSALV